jgi:hypothetical protein
MTTDRHWLGDLSLAVLLVLPTAALARAEAPAIPSGTAAPAHAAAPAVGPIPGRVGLLG